MRQGKALGRAPVATSRAGRTHRAVAGRTLYGSRAHANAIFMPHDYETMLCTLLTKAFAHAISGVARKGLVLSQSNKEGGATHCP